MRFFLLGILVSTSAFANWDIISPVRPERHLVATNVRFIGDIAQLMVSRGYRPENNCMQIVLATRNNQSVAQYRLEISPWACPANGALVEKPAMFAWFRSPYTTLMSEDGRLDLGKTGYTVNGMGQVTEWFVTDLCAFQFGNACDLYLDKDGRITFLSVRQ